MSKRVRINGAPSPVRARYVMRTRVSTDDPVDDYNKPAEGDEDLVGDDRPSDGLSVGDPAYWGLPRGPGRPKGSTNLLTRNLKQRMLDAAARHGSDGSGKDGLDGYLDLLAKEERHLFGRFLLRMLPLNVRAKLAASSVTMNVLEVVRGGAASVSGSQLPKWRTVIEHD